MIRTAAIACTLVLGILAGIAIVRWHSSPVVSENSRKEQSDEKLEMGYAREAVEWYNRQRAYPLEAVPPDWQEKAVGEIAAHNAAKSSAINAISWSSVGPTNLGGRTRAIAVDPNNNNIIYAGSVSGGVWKSIDAGKHWTALTDNQPTLIISSIAIDPANSSVIYAGTGEGYFNVDALRGAGILKSTDAGATWKQVRILSGVSVKYQDFYVYKIVVHPGNSQILYAALLGGVFKSINGGTSWSRVFISAKSPSICTDLVIDANTPSNVYAAFGLFDGDGVFKTTDGGSTWNSISGTFTAGYSRISLGIGKSNSQVLYACLCDAANSTTNAIMKTTDGGSSWTAASVPFDSEPLVNATHLGGQGWYNNVITVDPTDVNIVYTGGINVFKTTNGGTSWGRITDGYASPYIHVDQHAITIDPTNHLIVYFGNDGGIFRSTDGGSSFSDLNAGYITSQFYSGSTHPNLNTRIGGTQDNGTQKTLNNSTWNMVYSGDGGYTAINQTTTTLYYSEYVYLEMIRSSNSGNSWGRMMNGIPNTSGTAGTTDRCAFIAPFEMDPKNSSRLAAGTYKVYLCTDGANWSAISPDLTGDPNGPNGVGTAGSTISALAFAPTASNTLYAATSGSSTVRTRIAMTTNLSTWTVLTPPAPNRYFSSIAVDPNDANHVYVGVSGYSASTPSTPGHLFVTSNPSGGAWSNITGNLPDIPVNKVLLDPANVSHILLGTDLGVFESLNGGSTWTQTTGIPNVSVSDLDLRLFDGRVLAATHGRGMYFSDGALGVSPIDGSRVPERFALEQNYPNPFNPTTNIDYTLATESHVRLSIFDALGREVAVLENRDIPAGRYSTTFDGSNLASGIYFCRFSAMPSGGSTSGEIREVRKMVLAK